MNSKSILRPLFLAAMAICLNDQNSSAATFGKFTYTDNGTSITITGYPALEVGAVAIPATIAGKPVTAIGDSAFDHCASLTGVTIPDSVTSIGAKAFDVCYSLTAIVIPGKVTSIGDSAFLGCHSLTSVTIPASVTSIGIIPFFGTQVKAISVDPANSHYASIDGVLFDKAKTTLIEYPPGRSGAYSIPSPTANIGDSAFSYCAGLSGVTIPNSIVKIGKSAFSFCSGMTSVSIGNGVTSIGDSAFGECTSLASVTIPASVASFGIEAFLQCTKLVSATFLGNAPDMGIAASFAFYSCAPGFTIHYIKGKTGFTTPTWNGYPTVAIDPVPEIDVQQPVGSSLVDGTSKKSFGTVKTGMSSSKYFTIKNTGSANLNGLAITKTGVNATDFIVAAPAKTWLSPGTSTTFKVTFKPTATGNRYAVIHIKSNDANENPFDIGLSGLGVAP